MFWATIVLCMGASLARAGQVEPIAMAADASSVAARLSFPDSGEAIAAAAPLRDDRISDGSLTPQQALVPLPSGAWSGLVALGCLALVSGRKAIIRFIT